MALDAPSFDQLYARVNRRQRESLLAFRARHPLKSLEHEGITWQYVKLGRGERAALFLPGAIGTHSIWWQQLTHLANDVQLISINYPRLSTLAGLREGINALLDREGIDATHLIGSSMGGYLAQYLASTQPDRLLSAVFANTLAPNEPYLRAAPLLRFAVHILPVSVIYAIDRLYSRWRLLPAGGNDPLLEAYLLEVSYSGLSKQEMLSRISCVTETFAPLPEEKQTFPILIIDSENDPLIPPRVRRAVRSLYPGAQHYAFEGAGHFAYLSQPETYTALLRSFLRAS